MDSSIVTFDSLQFVFVHAALVHIQSSDAIGEVLTGLVQSHTIR